MTRLAPFEIHRATSVEEATALVDGDGPLPALAAPVVVKPRFGSGGAELAVCRDRDELARWQEALTGAWRLLVEVLRPDAEVLAQVLDCIVPVEPDLTKWLALFDAPV